MAQDGNHKGTVGSCKMFVVDKFCARRDGAGAVPVVEREADC